MIGMEGFDDFDAETIERARSEWPKVCLEVCQYGAALTLVAIDGMEDGGDYQKIWRLMVLEMDTPGVLGEDFD